MLSRKVKQASVHRLRNTGDGVLRLVYVFSVDSLDEVEYVFHDDGP